MRGEIQELKVHTNTEVPSFGVAGDQQEKYGKPMLLGPIHLQSLWLSRSGVGLENLHFLNNTGANEDEDDTLKDSWLS